MHCIEIFLSFWIFEQLCACPEKQSLPWNFSLYSICFYIQDFWAICACPEKQSFLENIHCIKNFSIIQDFWATLHLPRNRVCPENFHCIVHTFAFRIFEQLALALKNRGCPEFTLLSIYFLSFRIFEQLALALKTEFALKFFKPAGCRPPRPPSRTPMAIFITHVQYRTLLKTCSASYVVGNCSIYNSFIPNVRKTLTALDPKVQLSMLIKYDTGFNIALEVDETFLDVESDWLMLVIWQKGASPSPFLRNPTFGLISRTEWLLSKPQTTDGENNFFEFLI